MKRFCFIVALMALNSPASAGHSVSFVVGGHRIHIEAPRHCSSPACVFVSIPGVYQTRRGRDRVDDGDDLAAAPGKPFAPAPRQVSVTPVTPLAGKPPVEPVRPVVSAPPPPAVQPPRAAPPTPSVETPTEAARLAPDVAPKISRVSHEADDEPAETPLGDWQTEGRKGSVRIVQCGGALCGYVLSPSTGANGEVVLINMKPKAASEWSGDIYSRDSSDTYYATIAMKGANSLRVEACALGRYFCSGNLWSRISAAPERLISSRRSSLEPRS